MWEAAIAGRRFIAVAMAVALTIGAPPVSAQYFESDSKRFGGSKMDIVVEETERRPRVSVLKIHARVLGSSVGSSFFVLCSVRKLAQARGNYRYIVKIEDRPERGRMLVGFLDSREENFERLGKEFAALTSRENVIDLEEFAPICDSMM